jgi:ABC-type nitrate/sulfonate/bicarbonate transport system permease component
LGETLVMTLPGYLAGLLLGAVLAAGVVLVPKLEGGVLRGAVALRAIPIITTAPLIVLTLGRGATGTITIVAVMIFFPTLIACLQGLRQTPGQVVDMFRTYGAGRLRLLITAQIPAMLPAFFASARMAVPAALLAVTTTEWLATGNGIGSLMALTSATSDYNMLWSSVVVLSLAAVAAYALVTRIEQAVLRVYASEQVQ